MIMKNHLTNLKKNDFFSKWKNACTKVEKIGRTKGLFNLVNNKNGEELTKVYLKSDVIFFNCFFWKIYKSIT